MERSVERVVEWAVERSVQSIVSSSSAPSCLSVRPSAGPIVFCHTCTPYYHCVCWSILVILGPPPSFISGLRQGGVTRGRVVAAALLWRGFARPRSVPVLRNNALRPPYTGGGHKGYEVIVFVDSSTVVLYLCFIRGADEKRTTTRGGQENSKVGRASIVCRRQVWSWLSLEVGAGRGDTRRVSPIKPEPEWWTVLGLCPGGSLRCGLRMDGVRRWGSVYVGLHRPRATSRGLFCDGAVVTHWYE